MLICIEQDIANNMAFCYTLSKTTNKFTVPNISYLDSRKQLQSLTSTRLNVTLQFTHTIFKIPNISLLQNFAFPIYDILFYQMQRSVCFQVTLEIALQ